MTRPQPATSTQPPQPRTVDLDDGGVRTFAPAKLNLDLRVGPRREDGFHPLESVVVKVTLYDRIDLRARTDGEVTFSCAGADCGPDEWNLACRAARLLAEGHDVPGVDMELTKRIPPGGGIGGGSSDAAAVLGVLRTLWGLDVSDADLAGMAAELGSDVPLFLGGPVSRMTGRGEHLEPVTVHPFLAVLILPGLACPTADVYRAFDNMPAPPAGGLAVDALAGPPSTWRGDLVNDLAAAARRVCPELARLHEKLTEAVAPPVCITGSGSTMFILCDDAAEAAVAAGAAREVTDGEVLVVEPNPW